MLRFTSWENINQLVEEGIINQIQAALQSVKYLIKLSSMDFICTSSVLNKQNNDPGRKLKLDKTLGSIYIKIYFDMVLFKTQTKGE
jgi:hypothetical protein